MAISSVTLPAGSAQMIQYNSNGLFAAESQFKYLGGGSSILTVDGLQFTGASTPISIFVTNGKGLIVRAGGGVVTPGGTLTLSGGDGSPGGPTAITGGAAGAGGGAGGGVTITGGVGVNTSSGGVIITGGSATSTMTAGAVSMTGGSANVTGGAGSVVGGAGTGASGVGGAVKLKGGAGTTANGVVTLETALGVGLKISDDLSAVKLGFYAATPIAKPTTGSASATFVAGAGAAVQDVSTFDGYTIAQIVKALRDFGLLT